MFGLRLETRHLTPATSLRFDMSYGVTTHRNSRDSGVPGILRVVDRDNGRDKGSGHPL